MRKIIFLASEATRDFADRITLSGGDSKEYLNVFAISPGQTVILSGWIGHRCTMVSLTVHNGGPFTVTRFTVGTTSLLSYGEWLSGIPLESLNERSCRRPDGSPITIMPGQVVSVEVTNNGNRPLPVIIAMLVEVAFQKPGATS